ncbi:DUF2530 domain-containing protein [Agromyces silvae]|uniref:DUF2530 domain-containing protein n=1 Tax=Agromyces silvae TaxID=3388266 RepID=UPI00280AAF56|nr:DUF2530 domain-containing protein [Agromyces protaetiae]
MRLWVSEDERRPEPAPARADARKALVAGTAVWLVALIVCWWFLEPLDDAGFAWLLPTAIVGVVFGVAGVIVVQVHRARHRREPEARGGRD